MPSASPSAGDAPDPLMAEPREFQGVRISAMLQDETQTRPRISVFSNVDVLLKKKAAETERAKEKERAAAERSMGVVIGRSDDDQREVEEKENSFSVVYEANGRCEPFVVRVFKDGMEDRDALTVNINRFGRPVTED